MKHTPALALSIVLGMAGVPLTASTSSHAGSHSIHDKASPAVDAASNSAMTEGEIRKVDKNAGKITIRHAELKNLDMPPMTMVFQVKDKAMLDQVKAGDKVNFVADKVGGKFMVMQIEARK
jgi:Cu(I)/Ag(I) efflux system protein CusF